MARRGIASGRRFSGENGLLMKPPWPNRILLLLLCFVSELLFSSFSPAAHADSGTLYTSVDSVLFKLKKGQEILLVDVRDREAFDRFRIPGSIHVPLYALKTKTFLKEKTVVLVSVGYPDFALEQSCDAVKAVGFGKTSILNGGLRMWMLKKGPIQGDSFAAREVSRIPPEYFYPQRDSPDWVAVIVSGSGASASQALIPGATHLPFQGDARKFAFSLKTLIKCKPGTPQRSILVCDEKGDSYQSIERGIQQEEVRKVFYLKGGLEAYRAFLQQQALLGRPRREEVKRCVNCP
jgi:rhodanese-related sulfurtransferase